MCPKVLPQEKDILTAPFVEKEVQETIIQMKYGV
jgi:hypothetical protein